MRLLTQGKRRFWLHKHHAGGGPMNGKPTYDEAGAEFWALMQPVKADYYRLEQGGEYRRLFLFMTECGAPAEPLDRIKGEDGTRYTVLTVEDWGGHREITAERV